MRPNAAVAGLTTYRIGGRVRWLLQPADRADLRRALRWARAEGLRQILLGAGSNLLFPDGTLDAAVIHTAAHLTAVEALGDDRFRVQAGARNEVVASWLAKRGVAGLEFLYDVPGTLGGAAVMNASNQHGETSAVVEVVSYFEPGPDAAPAEARGADLGFGYRASAFGPASGRAIDAVLLHLPGRDEPAAIRARMDALRAERWSKFPCEYGNCGSVFKRPAGDFAGRLIEAAGCKGLREGDAQVSDKHAGFIVNLGAATAADVTRLIARVQARVAEVTGVRLERELIVLE